MTRARRARVAGMSGGSVWGRRGETAGKRRRAGQRGQERMRNRKKQVSQVTSRIRLAAALSSALAEAPAPDPAAPRVPRLRAPVRGTFAEARTPRSSRFGGQPAVASRAARVNRLPLAPFGLPLRLRAPVRASRAVKPRSPAPFALRGMTRRTPRRLPPAPTARDPLSGCSRLPAVIRPSVQAAFAEAPAPLPADVAGIRVAASQAACGEPLATRSAEPSNSTTWDNFNTIPKPERCQAFFQANFGNSQN